MPYTFSQRYDDHKIEFCKVIKSYINKFELINNKQDRIIILTELFNLLIQEKWFLKKSFHYYYGR